MDVHNTHTGACSRQQHARGCTLQPASPCLLSVVSNMYTRHMRSSQWHAFTASPLCAPSSPLSSNPTQPEVPDSPGYRANECQQMSRAVAKANALVVQWPSKALKGHMTCADTHHSPNSTAGHGLSTKHMGAQVNNATLLRQFSKPSSKKPMRNIMTRKQ